MIDTYGSIQERGGEDELIASVFEYSRKYLVSRTPNIQDG